MPNTLSRTCPMALVGMDTFRGDASSTLCRTQLYDKNNGSSSTDRSGLTRTASPISGNLLISSASSSKERVKDPISGTVLNVHGGRATCTAPQQKQQFLNSRNFYLTRDVDVTIQTLRNTTKVSRYTNEKVGTAGTPTGLDRTLTDYQAAK